MFIEETSDSVNQEEVVIEDNHSDDASDRESEAPKDSQTDEQHATKKSETAEQRRARIKRMYEREFGKQDKDDGEKGGQESGKESHKEAKVDDERYARLELKTEGITSKKAQDVVLEYARFKGIEVEEALKSPIVRGELAELEKKTSAPAPSKRTSAGASDSFEYWVAQAKKGNFPTNDSEMMAKLRKARIFTS